MRAVEKWREPTGPTLNEDYGAEPLPPTPFVDKWVRVEPRFPWVRVVLLIVVIDLVFRAWR